MNKQNWKSFPNNMVDPSEEMRMSVSGYNFNRVDGDLGQIFQCNFAHKTESKILIKLSYRRSLTALVLSGPLEKEIR